MYRTLGIIAPLGLAACGDIAETNPNGFSTNFEDGRITGTFDPVSWQPDEVQALIRQDCSTNNLASYTEATQPNGLIAFEAVCT